MSLSKNPPATQQATGRAPGRDSGGREINFGPEMGVPDELDKPPYLSSDASAFWDMIVAELKGSSVLRSVDATALAATAETYSRWREALQLRRTHGVVSQNRFGDTIRAPWVQVEADAAKALQSWLREFGLTPSAVSSLMQKQAPVDQLDDPFDYQAS
jgi:P27 family predicted phage terminase small subunit